MGTAQHDPLALFPHEKFRGVSFDKCHMGYRASHGSGHKGSWKSALFSINKYGEREAFAMAVRCRAQWEEEDTRRRWQETRDTLDRLVVVLMDTRDK